MDKSSVLQGSVELVVATRAKQRKHMRKACLIWGLSLLFVELQFWLALSSGVMVADLMESFSLTAVGAGILAGSFYYLYVLLQIPVGMLMDRYGPRYLLTLGSGVCAISCFLFSISEQLLLAEAARLLMGGGAAFAFVGSLHLLRQWFPANRFAALVGFAETIGMLGSMTGMLFLAQILKVWGWREAMWDAALFAFAIALLCWWFIEDSPSASSTKQDKKQMQPPPFWEGFFTVLKQPALWFNGLYSGLMFSLVTVFVALWGIPFIMQKIQVNLMTATLSGGILFIGGAIGCPLVGYLSGKLGRYRPFMLGGAIASTLIFSLILYAPISSTLHLSFWMFLVGLTCSTYILSFPIAHDLAPESAKSTAIGFTNLLAMGTAPVLQPFIGMVLDMTAEHPNLSSQDPYSLSDYQTALIILPLGLLLSCLLACFIPETHGKQMKR